MKVSSPGAPLRGLPAADVPVPAQAPRKGPAAHDVAPPARAVESPPLPGAALRGARAATPADVAAVVPRRLHLA